MQCERDFIRRHVKPVCHVAYGQKDGRIQHGPEKIEIELQRKLGRFRKITVDEFNGYIKGRNGIFGPEAEFLHGVT